MTGRSGPLRSTRHWKQLNFDRMWTYATVPSARMRRHAPSSSAPKTTLPVS
jgi:hypothetical protein